MISQIFKTGGGAGIGSYVLVMKNGELLQPSAEKIRWAYDSGENLFLSIIDDSTEEALLPLTGFVDNDDVLHLSGRDFDDNLTYQFSINGKSHEIETNVVEGITLGEGTVGDNSNFTVYEYDLFIHEGEEPQILTQEQMADIWENNYDVIKVNAHMQGEEPGSYDPGSYEPEETLVKMVFVRAQSIENYAITYATGVDAEKAITQIVIYKNGNQFSYELHDIDLSNGGDQDNIYCKNITVNDYAYITHIFNSENISLSSYPTDFSAGYARFNFSNRNGSAENPQPGVLSFSSDYENFHLESENNDYKHDQSGDTRLNVIRFYNDGMYTQAHSTHDGVVDAKTFFTCSIQNGQSVIQGEIQSNDITNRVVLNEYGLKLETISPSQTVEPVLTLGQQSLSESELATIKNRGGTQLYRHHFDIVLEHSDLSLIPEGATVAINVNALSTSGTAWETLSELDGGGYIVSAFGNIPNNFSYIFELRLFYSALANGTLLLNIHDLVNNEVKATAVITVGGGQSPNTFVLQDNVTEL